MWGLFTICKKEPGAYFILPDSGIRGKLKNPHTGLLKEIFLSNPVAKFLCQPSLPTPASLSFPKNTSARLSIISDFYGLCSQE